MWSSCGQIRPKPNAENSKDQAVSSEKTPLEMSSEPFSFEPIHDTGSEESDTHSSLSETCQRGLLLDKTVRIQFTHGRSSKPVHECCQCQCCSLQNIHDECRVLVLYGMDTIGFTSRYRCIPFQVIQILQCCVWTVWSWACGHTRWCSKLYVAPHLVN